MIPPSDAVFWNLLATSAVGLLTATVGLVWMDYRKKVEKLEASLEGKVDKDEMNRQRDNIETLFNKIDQHGQRDAEQFKDLAEMIHRNHMEVMQAVHDSGGRRRDRT